MNNFFTTNRIKIILVVLFATLAVKSIAPKLFLADSPKINPTFISKIIKAPGNFIASLKGLTIFNRQDKNQLDPEALVNGKQVNPSADTFFEYVSKGVAAAEDPVTRQEYLKIDAGTKYKIVGEIEVNGKKYPKIVFVE